MFCRKCGAELREGQKFCNYCGTEVHYNHPSQSMQQSQPTQQSQPVQPSQPSQPVQPMQFEQQPQVTKNAKEEKKQKQSGAMIVIMVVVIAIAAVLCFKFEVFDKRNTDNDDWTDEADAQDEPFEEEDDTYMASQEETSDTVDSFSAVELLQEKIASVCSELGDARGMSFDVRNEETHRYGSVGVIGSFIWDVSGDGVEDLILVYSTDDFAYTYADVYTVEDNQVISVATALELWEGMEADDSAGLVYVKQVGDSWYLYGDMASHYYHFADGVSGYLEVYDCSDHCYTQIQNYGYAGSDFEDYDEMPARGQDAGLDVGSDMTLGTPYAFSDQNVTLIAGYGLEVDEGYDWTKMNGLDFDGTVYGNITVAELTDTEGNSWGDAADSFFMNYQNLGWTDVSYNSYDSQDGFILPDSSSRRLTDSDLWEIQDDAYLLRLARNEIYARHGRMFDDEELSEYFMYMDWYYPEIPASDFSDDMLSQIEKDNIKLIKKYEEKLN
jgi:hypothetical protein